MSKFHFEIVDGLQTLKDPKGEPSPTSSKPRRLLKKWQSRSQVMWTMVHSMMLS